jgi:hypothetical protein
MLPSQLYHSASALISLRDDFNTHARQVASCIAEGHALRAHLDEFRDLHVNSKKEFIDHVEGVLKCTKTKFFSIFRNNDVDNEVSFFYHPPSNTVVIVPDNENHEPTAFRPAEGAAYFNHQLKSAKKQGFR